MNKLALGKIGHTKSNISAHAQQHCFRESLKWILIHHSMSNMATSLVALSGDTKKLYMQDSVLPTSVSAGW